MKERNKERIRDQFTGAILNEELGYDLKYNNKRNIYFVQNDTLSNMSTVTISRRDYLVKKLDNTNRTLDSYV